MTNAQIKVGLALGAGLCIGGGIGYYVGVRKTRAETEKEISGVKDLYRRLRDEDAEQARLDWSSPTEDFESEEEDLDEDSEESLEERALNLGYLSPDNVQGDGRRDPNHPKPTDHALGRDDVDDPSEESEYVRRIRVVNPNRDVDPDDVTQWDRSPDEPYVITEEEFRIDFPEHEKLSITYYKGDETLADDGDAYIPDPNGTVGIQNLQYFGLGSRDERLLYIRNERVGADFEVSLNDGSYAREVLGFGIGESMLKESKKGIKKMRPRE